MLPIRFFVVDGNIVAGFLDAYWEPDCDCEATTEYRGLLGGDTIAGTFMTRLQNGVIHTGRWSMRRRRMSASPKSVGTTDGAPARDDVIRLWLSPESIRCT